MLDKKNLNYTIIFTSFCTHGMILFDKIVPEYHVFHWLKRTVLCIAITTVEAFIIT